jgi:hypothetical protein
MATTIATGLRPGNGRASHNNDQAYAEQKNWSGLPRAAFRRPSVLGVMEWDIEDVDERLLIEGTVVQVSLDRRVGRSWLEVIAFCWRQRIDERCGYRSRSLLLSH